MILFMLKCIINNFSTYNKFNKVHKKIKKNVCCMLHVESVKRLLNFHVVKVHNVYSLFMETLCIINYMYRKKIVWNNVLSINMYNEQVI